MAGFGGEEGDMMTNGSFPGTHLECLSLLLQKVLGCLVLNFHVCCRHTGVLMNAPGIWSYDPFCTSRKPHDLVQSDSSCTS